MKPSDHPSNKVTLENIDQVFAPYISPAKVAAYDAIRKVAKELAKVILENTPDCSDRNAAIKSVRVAVMNADTAISLDPDDVPFELPVKG